MGKFFGVAIYQPKRQTNVGSLFRTAHILGAKLLVTIGPRYQRQASDTTKAYGSIPLFEHNTFEDFYSNIPRDCKLVGVEMSDKAELIENYSHPNRAIYLLGAEDYGIPEKYLSKCDHVVKLRGEMSMNVAVAGSVVLYGRNK